MIIKAALAFLVAMVALGIAGNWLRPRHREKPRGRRVEAARKCPACGTYLVGSAPCPCGGSGATDR